MFWRLGSVEDKLTGGRDGLVEGGVDPAVGADGLDQALDSRAQLGLLTVPEHDHRELVVGLRRQPGEGIGVGGVAGLGLLGPGQAQLAEEDLLKLLGRAEVELMARGGVRLLDGLLHGARELLLHALQPAPVRGDTGPLHPGQQLAGRQLHIAQQPVRADLRQLRLERRPEVEDRTGLSHQGVRLGLLVRAECELAVAGRGGGEITSQVFEGQRVQCEGAAAGLDQVGGQGGVHGDAVDAPAVLAEDPHQALGVVHHLGAGGIGAPGGEGPLVRLVELGRVEPGGRAVGGGQRHLGDAAAAQRPHVDRGHAQRPGAVFGQPPSEFAGVDDRAVHLDTGRRSGLLGGVGRAGVDGVQPVAQALVADLQRIEEDRQRLAVVGLAGQLRRAARQLDIAHHLREPHG